MSERFRFSLQRRRRRRSLAGRVPLSPQMLIHGLAALWGLVLLVYLWRGTPLLVPVLAALAAGTTDQALRLHPAARFRGLTDTLLYLFVPILYAAGAAMFLRAVSHGLWNVPAATLAAVLLSLAINAEYVAVDATPDTYPNARFILTLIGYLTAFAIFTVVSTSDLPLPMATLIVAITALLLGLDILRELDVHMSTVLAYAGATAVVIAEVRWAVYYLGLPDLLAGGLLLVTFYELTGLVQSYLSGHFDRGTVREFAAVGVLSLLIIAGFTVWSRHT